LHRRTPATPAALFLFPLALQNPDRSRPHLAISEIECRRGGLVYPSWMILDEYNLVQVDQAYDLVTTPIGAFSPAFVRKIAGVIKETAAQCRLRGIVRKFRTGM
jgi:hypothetical protein